MNNKTKYMINFQLEIQCSTFSSYLFFKYMFFKVWCSSSWLVVQHGSHYSGARGCLLTSYEFILLGTRFCLFVRSLMYNLTTSLISDAKTFKACYIYEPYFYVAISDHRCSFQASSPSPSSLLIGSCCVFFKGMRLSVAQ